MQFEVFPDPRAENRLYDKAFTAVNAPNVMHQAVTELIEPFQPRTTFPMGAPPVRYPDVTTVAGFVQDPAEDEADARNVAARLADKFDPTDPMPQAWDNMAVNKEEFQKDRTGPVSNAELINRVLFPEKDSKPLIAW